MNNAYTREQIIDMTAEQVTEALKEELQKNSYPDDPQWVYSLDVMHEVEKLFSDDGWDRYPRLLAYIGMVIHQKETIHLGSFGEFESIIIHATACEKAKAWLMTLIEQRLGSIATR